MKAPATTPLEVRDRMIEGYYRGYQGRVSLEEATRQAIADCELVDAARAAGDLTRGAPAKKLAPGASMRPDVLADAQRYTGTTLRKAADEPHYQRFQSLHKNPQKISERWGAAVARIFRILQGIQKSSSLVVAVEGAELGELATAYMDTYAHFMTRAQRPPLSGNDPNPFRGLSDRDASRKFMRLVEDICDKSTGKLGSWYVK